MKNEKHELPLVYSCSGCSSAAQMANYLALQLDRSGEAEMSCIAGVGGGVKKLVKTALSGRKIIALDGCPLACTAASLDRYRIKPDLHVELTQFGVKKIQHVDFNIDEAQSVLQQVKAKLRSSQERITETEETGQCVVATIPSAGFLPGS